MKLIGTLSSNDVKFRSMLAFAAPFQVPTNPLRHGTDPDVNSLFSSFFFCISLLNSHLLYRTLDEEE
jgi:hypothetical protein